MSKVPFNMKRTSNTNFNVGNDVNCPKRAGGACAVIVEPCRPTFSDVMFHPSPLGVRPWCWQTSAIYEFLACVIFGTIVLWSSLAPIGPAAVGVAQGLGLGVVIALFWQKDAGIINPAFALVRVLLGKLPGGWLGFVVYCFTEAAGFLVATLFTLAISPGFNKNLGLGAPVIAGALGVGPAASAELIGTFFFCLVGVLVIGFRDLYEIQYDDNVETVQDGTSLIHKRKTPRNLFSLPEAIIMGFLNVALVTTLVLFTGASFNDFRWLWPSVISGTISNNWWVHAVMPLLAALAVFILTAPIFYWEKVRWLAFTKKYTEV